MKPSDRESIIRYVLGRKCASGGFCFYRLDEPNGSDTFYALSVLKIIGFDFRDDRTLLYLKSMQNPDGSYDSVFKAFYSLQGLRLMNGTPASYPAPYIRSQLRPYDVALLPPEVSSIFKQMFTVVELCSAWGIRLEQEARRNAVRFILRFRNGDGGFGSPYSTLIETAQALEMLNMLNCPEALNAAEAFVVGCESPVHGFVNVPRTSLSYIEYMHAGAVALSLLSSKPEYPDKCTEVIWACRNRNGGFSRASHAGIATIEDTYYGVHALSLFSEFPAGQLKIS
ncbi:MAG: prenyltransferase/squalene oxidase repeat-containing protein [Syntrophales bacterium]|nr:prenyltransferase/squalene oxidase repeat-containing protein [Syntrophales bacterium]